MAEMFDGAFGIIGAMSVEVEPILSVLTGGQRQTYAGSTFCAGILKNTEVVVVCSGIGKVNAALCTQLLIDHYHVAAVINTGVAGALDRRLTAGDVVVATAARYHDVDATAFGYPLGLIPGTSDQDYPYKAHHDLVARLVASCHEVVPEVSMFEGIIATGDQVIADDQRKRRVHADTHALCCEMEGAAVAHVAQKNGVPFAIVRVISDEADAGAATSYAEFEHQAAKRCARIVENALESVRSGKG